MEKIRLCESEVRKFNDTINLVIKKIRKGFSEEKIIKELKERRTKFLNFSPREIYSIAKNRIKAKKKFGKLSEYLFFDDSGLRYSTPPIVAEYRAKRLKTNRIADISCGIGSQLIFFAKKCKESIGVEINKKRSFMAVMNMMNLKIENAEIINGDCLSKEIIKQINADIIFSDPARPPEAEIRTLNGLKPHPEIVYGMYSKITENIAFELPPQMPPERIPINGEKEYTSLDFKLNRLALYTGELKNCDVSAITLPSEERITSDDEEERIEKGEKIEDFIHEVDFTLIKANLLPNLIGKLNHQTKLLYSDSRRTLLTSKSRTDTNFLRDYSVEDVCNFSVSEINKELKKLSAKKVTLRFSTPPKEYWNLRKKLEDGLSGDEWFYLFRIGDKAIISRRCE